ncbi:MAG: hypothetical protein E7031_00670 [Akkermansiaceae bacterium]|nr:hypothetical protein [Akkermansiaceae bacterium]
MITRIIARVKLSALKIYALKLALYTGGLLYMAIDLFIWQGPLWGILYERQKAEDNLAPSPTVLNIYGEKTTEQQWARRVAELKTLGVSEDYLTAKTTTDIIGNSLLRMRARYNDRNIPNFQAEAHTLAETILARAKNTQQADTWLSSQGYNRETLQHKLASIMRQQHYLEDTLKERTAASDEEAQIIASQMGEHLVMPEHRQVSHIFLSTNNKDEEEVKARAEDILSQLTAAPETFADLAKQHSEDPRTAPVGGNLGTVYAHHTSPLKEINLLGIDPIPAGVPVLVRSRWGWHIVLAGEIQEPRPLTTKEYNDSIRSAIVSHKTEQAVDMWMEANINEAKKKNKIQTHVK